MGITKNNSITGLSGRVGSFIGSAWNGTQVLKAPPRVKRNHKFTQPQLEQQAKFKVVIEHVQQMSTLLSRTYSNIKGAKTAFNKAMANVVNNAMTGTYPDYVIDWSKVMMGSGKLFRPDHVTVVANGTTVQFTWSPETDDKSNNLDAAVLVIYCPETRRCYYNLGRYTRSDGTGELAIPNLAGRTVHTYISFIAARGRNTSDSVYTGEFTLQA